MVFIRKNIHFLFLSIVVIEIIQFLESIFLSHNSWDLNRTIGWGPGPKEWIFEFLAYNYPLILFTIIYFIIAKLGYQLNNLLSMIHLIIVASIFISKFIFLDLNFHYFEIVSWIVFGLNLFYAFRKGK